MPRGPLTFRQRDVERMIKGARRAGLLVGRVEITKDGTIAVVTGADEKSTPDANEWDSVLAGAATQE